MEVTHPTKKVTAGQESRTVFISNLNYLTSIDAVSAVFNDCGAVKEARLVKDFKGRSKGFGFIVFENIDSMNKALAKDRTPIGSRPIFVSIYDTEKDGHKFKYSTGVEKEKLFVRGLPYSMSEKEIKEAFEVHAPVSEIRLVTHRNGYSKGSCYLRFSDGKTAEKVRHAMDQTELRGFTITVLVSDPSSAKRELARKLPSEGEEIGARRPKLAFVPRALTTKTAVKATTPATASSSSADATSTDAVSEDITDPPIAKTNDDFRKMLMKK